MTQVWNWSVKRFLSLLREQAIFMYTMTSVTFDLMTPKSDKFIVPPICKYDPSLKLIPQTVLKLSQEREPFSRTQWPVTFDLMTPKSNKFIDPHICTYDPSFKFIPQTVLKLSREQTIFMYTMTSVTFDLWPQNLISSLPLPYAHITQVWSWPVTQFLSYCENEPFSCIQWHLWPLTFDLMTLKSNQFIAPPIGTHYPSLKLTRQTVFKLWRERAIFMHTMTSVTFDLWPNDPKV